MSQCDAILAALKRGEPITPGIAYQRFRTLALHSRIAELRERGYDIECKINVDGSFRYGSYRLIGQSEMVL